MAIWLNVPVWVYLSPFHVAITVSYKLTLSLVSESLVRLLSRFNSPSDLFGLVNLLRQVTKSN